MAGTIVGASFINPDRFVQKLAKAFETWAKEDINDAYWGDQFREDKWSYGGETRRKNGEVVTSPRDIYDLGALYASGRESFTLSRSGTDVAASWNWDAKNSSGGAYALYVHEGLSTNLDPRPWTDELYYPQMFEGSSVHLALKRRIKAAFQSK
jgi:hypothetical protein